MKIGGWSFQVVFPKVIKSKKVQNPEVAATGQTTDPKQTLKETIQRQIAEMEEARTNMGEDNPKAQRFIEKFKSGSKLTPEEMEYVRKNAPGITDYIDRIMREREMIELAMKSAPSKTDVQIATVRFVKQIEKHPNPEEREIRAKHLMDAKQKYEQTDEYKNKPNTPLDDDKKRPVKGKQKETSKQSVKVVIDAYEKTSFKKAEINFKNKLVYKEYT